MRDTGRRIDIPVAFLTWLAAWLLGQIVALVVYSAGGYEEFRADYQVRARAVDVLGVPIGVLTQLVLVPLVYLPLEALWEDVFTEERLTENAKDLVDRASGGSMVLLVLMVCLGAPLVEELVYRGLLQGSSCSPSSTSAPSSTRVCS
jgi:membrane protease YdiL (CAAX protease family)